MTTRVGRLLSADGAAFALLPVSDLTSLGTGRGDSLLVDIELLSPDRLVRYLARSVATRFFESLADAYLAAAQEAYPEQSVATVQDQQGGVAATVLGSTPFIVTLEALVNPDLEADIVEYDGVVFDVTRASLVTATHEIRQWLNLSNTGLRAIP